MQILNYEKNCNNIYVLLNVYGTCPFILGEGLCLNEMLRRIHGRKRREITEDWRKLHNEELYISHNY